MNHPVGNHFMIVAPRVRAIPNHHQDSAPDGAPFLVIGPCSPLPWRKAVEEMAVFFQRELEYDHPPYGATEIDYNRKLAKDRVLVFARDAVTPKGDDIFFFFGAVGVRWREWDDMPAGWSIAWAWFHPYQRRKGHLTKAWKYITEMFPDPWVEHPLSNTMESFLRKVGHTKPLNPPLK